MVGTGLVKYAKENNLKVASGVAYGVIDGYMVTMTDGSGIKTVAFSGGVTDGVASAVTTRFGDDSLKKEYRIEAVNITRESVTVIFTDTVGTMKKIAEAMKVLPGILRQCGILTDGFCTACGNNIEAIQESRVVLINGVAHRIHSSCAQNLDMRAEVEKNDYKSENKNLGRGILGALLGALLGGIVWGAVYYIGYFAAIVGVLIAFLAKKGYELLGGKVCRSKTIIVLLATILGVIVGQVGVYFVLIGMDLVSSGFSLMAIPYVFIETLKVDAEFLKSFLSDLAGGLFFGILGAIGTVVTSNREHKNATFKSQILE